MSTSSSSTQKDKEKGDFTPFLVADKAAAHRTAQDAPDAEDPASKLLEPATPPVKQDASASASAAAPPSPVELPRIPLSPFLFWTTYASLTLVIFLAALDATIVAAALGAIVQDLGREDLAPWLGSVFLVTSTVANALAGKLSVTAGRRATVVLAGVLFLGGSALCGAAPSMEVLIVGRAVAGLGAGCILSVVIIILTDIVTPSFQGIYLGAASGVWGLSAVLGPLVGGAFSDQGLWRWCFYINLPAGLPPLGVLMLAIRSECVSSDRRLGPTLLANLRQVDLAGALLAFVAILALLTPLQLAGSSWAWNSTQTIVLLAIVPLATALFVWYEATIASAPMAPPALFLNRNVSALFALATAVGAVYYGTLTYLSLFFQVNFGYSATLAGVQSTPYLVGTVVGTVGSSYVLKATGRFLSMLYVGAILAVGFTTGISFFTVSSSLAFRIFILLFSGLANGLGAQLRLLAVQHYVEGEDADVALALSQFFISLGGAIGVAVAGTTINNVLALAIRTSSPTLQFALSVPPLSLLVTDPTQAVALRAALTDAAVAPRVPGGADKALEELVAAFTGAFAAGVRTLIGFSVVGVGAVVALRERRAGVPDVSTM
ncbi:major facilitator superfamily domain-containing protein [Zopfochytrium polystomum]|nr:major facilitator superfamily domain-containing protein [Zopfochytrium polystomum]